MTDKEMLAMRGHEFIYEFEDGDTIDAYVKQVDLQKGMMTCWSFSHTTHNGEFLAPINQDEYDEGAVCLVFTKDLEETERKLTIIRDNGRYTASPRVGFFVGCPL